MHRVITSLLFLTFLLASCAESSYEEPDFYFKGTFKSEFVADTAAYMKLLASKKGFRLFEKRRSQMSALTNNRQALFIAFYESGNTLPILTLSNIGGDGEKLVMAIYANENFSIERAKELSNEVRQQLKAQFDVDMIVEDPDGRH